MALVIDLDNLGYYLGANVTPPATYTTGTITTTLNNATITGVGTSWTSALVGRTLRVGTSGTSSISNTYIITTVTNTTSLTVVSANDGVSTPTIAAGSGQSYAINANITIDTFGKLIYIRQGNIVDTGGVTLKAVYSKLKNIWKNDSTAIKFSFPMVPITDEQMEFGNSTDSWKPGDDTSRQLIRTGGWAEKTGGTSNREYAGIVSLGSLLSSEQPYYIQTNSQAATTANIVLTGPVNQAVQTYGDTINGNFDYRAYFKIYVRTQGRNYASSSLTDIGVTTMTYQVYRFPLVSSNDVNIVDSDVTVSAFGVTATWYASPQSITIGGSNYNFSILVNGNNKTKLQIYEALQYLIRQATDIDNGAGIRYGSVVDSFATYVGGTLTTQQISGLGVYIQNYNNADINSLVFTDDTGTTRTFPFTAGLQISFGSNLQSDSNSIYRVFFTTNPAGNFGTANAVLVQDSSGNNMSGSANVSTVALTFAYDTNVQGGRTSATDAAVTVVAIGLSTSQYISATGTITRSATNPVSLVSALERNYINP
jgi:hypothetical protein